MGRRTIGDTKMTGAQRMQRMRSLRRLQGKEDSAEAILSAQLVPPDQINGAETSRRSRKMKKNSAEAVPPAQRPVMLDETALEECFQEAISKSRLKMPPRELYKSCADFILKQTLKPKESKDKKPILDLLKCGKVLLRKADDVRPILEERYHKVQRYGLPDEENEWFSQLEDLAGATKLLRSFITKWDVPNPTDFHKSSWRDIAVVAAGAAVFMWRKVGNPPRSTHNHDDPICVFVAEILKKLEIPASAYAVSAVLRGGTAAAMRKKARIKAVLGNVRLYYSE